MQTQVNEQPGAVVRKTEERQPQQPEERTPGPPQFETFRGRVIANIDVPHWRSEVQQYYIERPHLIPGALLRGMDTMVVTDLEGARDALEQFIWDSKRSPMVQSLVSNFDDATRIIIWITRQSKGLTEEVVLYSPFDPDEEGFNCSLAEEAGRLLSVLTSCYYGTIIWTILKGLGSPLMFSVCFSNNVHRFSFTVDSNGQGKKFKRLYWRDAVEGSKGICPPEIVKIVKG